MIASAIETMNRNLMALTDRLETRSGGEQPTRPCAVRRTPLQPTVEDDGDMLGPGKLYTVGASSRAREPSELDSMTKKKLLNYEAKHGKSPDVEWMRALLKQRVDWLRNNDLIGDPPSGKDSGISSSLKATPQQRGKQAIGLVTTFEGEHGTTRTSYQDDHPGFSSSASECRICLNKGQPSYHPIHACKLFWSLSLQERRRWIQVLQLCFCCLKANHRAEECITRAPCDVPGCGENHSRLLHLDRAYQGAWSRQGRASRQDDLRVELNQCRGGRSVDVKGDPISSTSNKR